MIVFVAGTTAEFIKIAPVIVELDKRGIDYRIWSTAQHAQGVEETLSDLGVRQPDRYLVSKHRTGVATVSQVPRWLADLTVTTLRSLPTLRQEANKGIVAVHGDTFTTVIGAILGRTIGAKVAHIEAGLRSGSWRSPFPEELNRRIVGRLAHIHFAPTAREAQNLKYRIGRRGVRVVVTEANTVVDALRTAREVQAPAPELPEEFGLVTLHRFELVHDREAYRTVIERVKELSHKIPLVMIIGKSEQALLAEYGFENIFDERLIPIDKLGYSSFQAILLRAKLVITDSGGLQEECAALGIPCAVHREYTERHQGLGANIVLTGMNVDVLDDFLANWSDYQRPSQLDAFHPSRMIVDVLEEETGPQGA
ncbi:UDP-N-acetyl glucosamine 2-epimerase [Schaalia sp. Marseille-Q2122]|uniref:UDP-N-acetyl glucosamine 2-epimerase n=1 Tax=Schaalia sp. Marseille-Q2122 TaxID=2736604 RepID=UPI0015890091|nr:UDP-N-acetylglucosamine 2-epimerase [Schaalia sp. Marseille-Q2122]